MIAEGQKELGDISPIAMVMAAGLTAACHMDVDWLLQIEELWLLSGGEKCCANYKDVLPENKDKAEQQKRKLQNVWTHEHH